MEDECQRGILQRAKSIMSLKGIVPLSAPAIVNASTLAELGDVIGRDRLEKLIVRFSQALTEAYPENERPVAEIGREAHMLVSMSGMLGCDAFSAACRVLEQQAKKGDAIAEPLAEVRRMRDATLGALAEKAQARN